MTRTRANTSAAGDCCVATSQRGWLPRAGSLALAWTTMLPLESSLVNELPVPESHHLTVDRGRREAGTALATAAPPCALSTLRRTRTSTLRSAASPILGLHSAACSLVDSRWTLARTFRARPPLARSLSPTRSLARAHAPAAGGLAGSTDTRTTERA